MTGTRAKISGKRPKQKTLQTKKKSRPVDCDESGVHWRTTARLVMESTPVPLQAHELLGRIMAHGHDPRAPTIKSVTDWLEDTAQSGFISELGNGKYGPRAVTVPTVTNWSEVSRLAAEPVRPVYYPPAQPLNSSVPAQQRQAPPPQPATYQAPPLPYQWQVPQPPPTPVYAAPSATVYTAPVPGPVQRKRTAEEIAHHGMQVECVELQKFVVEKLIQSIVQKELGELVKINIIGKYMENFARMHGGLVRWKLHGGPIGENTAYALPHVQTPSSAWLEAGH